MDRCKMCDLDKDPVFLWLTRVAVQEFDRVGGLVWEFVDDS